MKVLHSIDTRAFAAAGFLVIAGVLALQTAVQISDEQNRLADRAKLEIERTLYLVKPRLTRYALEGDRPALQAAVTALAAGQDVQIAVADATGVVVAADRRTWLGKPLQQVAQRRAAPLPPPSHELSWNGTTQLISFEPLADDRPGGARSDYLLFYRRDLARTQARIRAAAWRDAGVSVSVVLGVVLFLVILHAGFISRPILVIATRLRQLGESGHADPVAVRGSGDLSRLGDAFNAAGAELAARLVALESARLEVAEQRDYLAVTLRSIGDAVITTDAVTAVTAMNPIAEQITGWNEQDARGRPLEEVFDVRDPATRLASPLALDRVLEAGESIELTEQSVLHARDGREVRIENSAAPIRRADGRMQGVILIFRDVTAEYGLRRALEDSERRLRTALESGDVGIWEWDLRTDAFSHAGPWVKFFSELAPQGINSGAERLEFTHPSDVELSRRALVRHFKGETPLYEVEQRGLQRDGTYRHFLVRGRATARDENGRVVTMAGTYTDISALRAEQQRLELALEYGREGLFEWWPRQDVLELSASWYTLYRREPGSVRNASFDFAALVHPEDVAAAQDATRRALKGPAALAAEFRVFRGDGSMGWMMARGVVTERDYTGRALRMLGTHVDITEMKAVQERLQLAVDATGQGIIEWWPQEDRLAPTAGWLALTGYGPGEIESAAQIVGARLVHPEDGPAFAEFLASLASGQVNTARIEARFRMKSGEFHWLLGSGKAAETDAAGRAVRVVGTFIDITNLKLAEQRLEIAVEAARQAIWEWLPESDRLVTGRSWQRLFGHAPGDVPTMAALRARVLHPRDVATATRILDEMSHGQREHGELELRMRRLDGSYLDVIARAVVTERDEQGRAVRIVGTDIDISELTEARAALEASRTHLELVIQSAGAGIWDWDLVTDATSFNSSWAEMLGYTLDDLRPTSAATWRSLVHPDDRPRAEAALAEVFAGHLDVYECTHRLRHRDGHWVWVNDSGRITERDAEGKPVRMTGTHIDVTDLKTAFDTIEAEHARLEMVIRGTGAGVWEYDLPSGTTVINERYAHLLGYSTVAEFGPTSFAHWRERVHPDDVSRVEAVLTRYLAGEEPGYACDYRMRHRDGHWLWIHDNGQVVLRDAGGRPLRMAGIYLDITMRVERDRHLKAIAEAVTQVRGGDLLTTVVRTARELAEASHAYVAALEPDGEHVTIIAAAPEDAGLAGTVYPLVPGSPCANVFSEHTCIYTDAVAARFPADQMLRTLDIECYAGQRLSSDDDTVEGIFVLLFTRPVPDVERVRSVLDILSATATHELGRERRAAALRDSELRYRRIYETMPVMLCSLDSHGLIIDVNEAWVHITGYSLHRCIGQRVTQYFAPDSSDYLADLLDGHKPSEERAYFELVNRRGGIITTTCALFGSGRIANSDLRILALEDVTEKLQAGREIERLAFYDPLTGLPNRRYLLDRLGPAIAAARRRGTHGALLFIDLDHFKQINDSVGHAVGDEVLVQVGNRLRELTRQEDVVSRFGGDEFIVMLAEVSLMHDNSRVHAETVARKITIELSRPYLVGAHEFHLTPTIGIAVFPDQSDNASDILKAADSAMYKGKIEGRNTFRFYHASMATAASERMLLEKQLRAALDADQLELFFQPQIDSDSGVIGAEALLRWRHPERGLVPPDTFIPIAEESNLIQTLGEWVIRRAFVVLKGWLDDGMSNIDHLSVNVSSRQFRAVDFVENLELQRARADVPARFMVLEITERTVIDDIEGTIEKMTELRRLGFRFSIDDFGIGYSSLAYLRRLPLDQLKVDRSFVRDVVEDANAGIIAETIISMGRQLGLETIAEGVETEAQRDFLVARGCRGFQGYLFCRPVSEAEFRDFYRSYRHT